MIVQRCKGHKYVLLLTLVFMLVACNSTENDNVSEGGDGNDAYICNEWASDLVNDRYGEVYPQVPKFGGREKYWWPVDFVWSPDSQRIIFRNPSQQLYWIEIDEQKPRLLTVKTGYNPEWSPDGQQVAFILTESDLYYLAVVNIETQQEMVFDTTPNVILGWTSDSERVRFITTERGRYSYPYLHEVAIVSNTLSSARIFPERLGSDLNFSITDPSRFIVSRPTGTDHPSLFVGDIEQGDLQQITTRRGCDQFPVWSPTSDQIVFMSDRNENWDVFLLDTGNGRDTEENLTNSPAQEYHSSWSPDGQYVAFTRFEPTGWNEAKQDIFVMNVETREIRQLTDTPDELESYPQWSPDGQALAFVTLSQEQWYIDLVDLRTNKRSRIITIGPEIQDDER